MPKKSDPLREAVGRRLKQLRLALGFEKLRHFADHIGVTEEVYIKWEKGKALIPATEVEELKRRFGITADWLYFGDESGLGRTVEEKLRQAA